MYSISFLAHPPPASRVPRYFAWAWAGVLLVAGWFPFSGWEDTGVPLFAFLTYDWPYYFSRFDFGLNIAAFVPLGATIWLDRRRRGGIRGWLIAVILGGLLSLLIELVQVYLPGRDASKVDLLANTLGAAVGAALAAVWRKLPFAPALARLRHRLFVNGAVADLGLVLLLVWLLAQINPALPLFGVVVKPVGLPQPFESPLQDPALFLRLLEIGGATLHFLNVGMFLATLLRIHQHPLRAMALLAVSALLIKLLMAGMLLNPGDFFSWLNLNVLAAQLIGWLLLAAVCRLHRRWLALLGILTMVASEAVSYFWPLNANPIAMLELFRWSLGHLQNFSAVASLAADAWPLGTLIYFALYLRFHGREE